MTTLREQLESSLPEPTRAWLAQAPDLPVALPQLPRRCGRGLLGLERRTVDGCDVDFSAWRACDVAAAILFDMHEPDHAAILDLFAHGDFEERVMVMRTRALAPADDTTVALLGEAQRTNTQDHMEALTLDCDLVARAADAGFSREDFNRLVLKAAFVDMPFGRMFGAERHANSELSAMLQDLATEREAACRKVWYDTNRLIGRAPTDGTVARLIGGLEHGDDNHRLAAAEGLEALGHRELIEHLVHRLPREPHPIVRAAIERAIQATS